MLLTFLGAIAAGVLGACVAFIIRRILGRNVRFLIPLFAGGAMLGFTVWNDYDWIGRQRAGLPPTIEIVQTRAPTMFLKPWSYVSAPVVGYLALDRTTLARHPESPEIARARVIVAERFQPTRFFVEYVDCERGRAVNVTPEAMRDETGFPPPPPEQAWAPRALDDLLLLAACGTG